MTCLKFWWSPEFSVSLDFQDFSKEDWGRKISLCVSVWGAVEVRCCHLSPLSWLILMVQGSVSTLLLSTFSSRPLDKGEIIRSQLISEFPGPLKANAVFLQCFFFKIPPAPYSLWRGLTKDLGYTSCNFVIWILDFEQILCPRHGKPQVSFRCCLWGNFWND